MGHSPTALSAELGSRVDELGAVAAIVAPNNGHNLWLEEWHSAYPNATCFVARGIPKKVPALGGYRFIDAEAAATWSADLAVETMAGVPLFDESAFLHRASRSLIVTDIVQKGSGS